MFYSVSFDIVLEGIILFVIQVVMHQYVPISIDKLIMRVYHNLTGILIHLLADPSPRKTEIC